MEWSEKNELIEAILLDMSMSTNGWRRSNCPFCEMETGMPDKRYSFGINTITEHYNCYRCGISGKYRGAREFFGTSEDAIANYKQPETLASIAPPSNAHPLWEDDYWESYTYEVPREYMVGRGFDRDVVTQGQVHACFEGEYVGPTKTQRVHNRVLVPILAPDNVTWLGWSARDWTDTSRRKYMYPEGMVRGQILFNHAALLVETSEPAIIVEGVFDALRFMDCAVACLGKPSRWQKGALLSARRPVAVCLDGDAWQEGEALSLLLRINGVRAGFVRLPPTSDPGNVDAAWLREQAARCVDN